MVSCLDAVGITRTIWKSLLQLAAPPEMAKWREQQIDKQKIAEWMEQRRNASGPATPPK